MAEKQRSNNMHTRKTILWFIAALTWILICVILLAYRLTIPTDGWLSVEPDGFNSNGFIYRQNLLGLPSPLQPDDQVVKVNGIPIINGLYISTESKNSLQAGDSVEYSIIRGDQSLNFQVPLGNWSVALVLSKTMLANPTTMFTWVGMFVFVTISFYTYLRRPKIPAAFALMFLATFIFSIFLTMNILPPMVADVLDQTANIGLVTIVFLTFSIFVPTTLIRFGFSFPHLKPIIVKRPWLNYLPLVGSAGVIIAFFMQWYVVGWIWVGVSVLITIGLLVHNGNTMRDTISRAQMRWALGGTILGLILFSMTFLNFLFIDTSVSFLGQLLSALGSLGFPVMGISLAVAILRHQLFNLERIINRALVYFSLTLSVIVLYILVVGYLSYLFQTQGNLLISLIATGTVAVLFEPLHRSLRRAINRLMYGERDEPYEFLMQIGKQLESSLDYSNGLSLMVETIAKALKIPFVALVLWQENDKQITTQYGTPQNELNKFPLVIAGQGIGELIVSTRSPNEPFSKADLQLFENLARQISATAQAYLLDLRLEQARLRLVTERGEARRQLGRDLHDGVGHQLTGLVQQLEQIKKNIENEPRTFEKNISLMNQQVNDLIMHVRELARQIFPPELELLGLIGALQERILSHPELKISFDAPVDFPELPAEIETAVYYIVIEALTNIEKHAQAKNCYIELSLEAPPTNSFLKLTIRDDGLGLAKPTNSGIGLLSMQARAAEVGGTFVIDAKPGFGTTISVHIPYFL